MKIEQQKRINTFKKRAKDCLIEMFGGACQVCGYNKCNEALEFHHKNKEEKEFSISYKIMSLENLIKETSKCVLLCSNCHREVHYGKLSIINIGTKIPNINIIKKYFKEKGVYQYDNCPICGNKKLNIRKYCSSKCSSIGIRKIINRPNINKLKKEYEISNYEKMGIKYGVSGTTIKKWIKQGSVVESGKTSI